MKYYRKVKENKLVNAYAYIVGCLMTWHEVAAEKYTAITALFMGILLWAVFIK